MLRLMLSTLVSKLKTHMATTRLIHLVHLFVVDWETTTSCGVVIDGSFSRMAKPGSLGWVAVGKWWLGGLQVAGSTIHKFAFLMTPRWGGVHWKSRGLCLIAALANIRRCWMCLLENRVTCIFTCRYLHMFSGSHVVVLLVPFTLPDAYRAVS